MFCTSENVVHYVFCDCTVVGQSCRLDFKAVQCHQGDKLCTSYSDNQKILNDCIKLFSLMCSLLIVCLLQKFQQ